jgi:hypothetical protein
MGDPVPRLPAWARQPGPLPPPEGVWIAMEPSAPPPEKPPGPVALNPVAIAWAANLLVAMLAGFGLHLTTAQAGAVTVIAAALVGVVTAVTARPWYIPGITGAATAALSAGAAFGLDWTPEQIGLAATALSLVLLLATRQAVIPAAAARRGLTGEDIMLARLVAPRPGPAAGDAATEPATRRLPGGAPPLP